MSSLADFICGTRIVYYLSALIVERNIYFHQNQVLTTSSNIQDVFASDLIFRVVLFGEYKHPPVFQTAENVAILTTEVWRDR